VIPIITPITADQKDDLAMRYDGQFYVKKERGKSEFHDKLAHIYIVIYGEYEVIRKGDVVYDHNKDIITLEDGKDLDYSQDYYHKVISTDDIVFNLPRPSVGFLEKFADSQNKNRPIVFVRVEFETRDCSTDYYDSGCGDAKEKLVIKVDKNNEVTIKRAVNVNDRQDLMTLLQEFMVMGVESQRKNFGFNERFIEMIEDYGL
jgi:hypothetical protein